IAPSNMYNMDGKGLMMGVALCCKVIGKRDSRSAKLTEDGSHKWVTVIETISGDGQVLWPMIVNKGQAHNMSWYAKLKKKDVATFGVSEKGWSNERLRLRWLKKVFDKETQER
ncbi:hypothetical protein C7212DRAFT_161411, partial [Tuber magnatum]